MDASGEALRAQTIPRRRAAVACAASFSQQQLWLLDRLVPGSPAYNIMDVVSIRGPYDPRAMLGALNALVQRHEILRTAFARVDGQLVQVVGRPFELALPEVDLRAASEEVRRREWTRVVREQGRTPFDLANVPLIRVTVVHMSATEHRLLLTIHHIIADEWSMELIQKELGEFYTAFSQGRLPSLEPLPLQYADFAVWQRESLQGSALQTQTDYWKNELKGAMPVLAFPTDKPRPATSTLRGATETFTLSKQSLARLQALGRQEQATLFMALEATFAALLYRYTGQDDILVGTPVSGRTHAELQGLIGCFLNTVVLRTQFQDDLAFRGLLHQVRGRTLGAFAHAEMPFEQLVAELSPDRNPGRTPLFQVMFVLYGRDGVSQVSHPSGSRELDTGTSKFDLTLFMSETDDGLDGLIEYSTDLFETGTIRRLCDSFARLMEAASAEPDKPLSRLSLLAEQDRQLLVADWNRTEVEHKDGNLCLHQLVARQAARTPERVALVCERETMTYAEVDQRSDLLARHLVSLGVEPDVLVGLLVERSLDMVVGLLGILKAGGAYVPLDPSFPPDRQAYMISDARLRVLVTHRGLEGALESLPSRVVRLDHDWGEISKSNEPLSGRKVVGPEHLAYVLYTSGSTGMPKGVGISHSAIVNFLLSMQKEPGLTASDTLLAVTTLSFDIAGLELYLPLVSGAKVVIASRQDAVDPHQLIARLGENACTFMQATPTTWHSLVDAGWQGSSGFKALCGGEAMPVELARVLLERGIQLWNMYGPTETTVWSTLHHVVTADVQPPIGHPIANTQVYVLDAHRELVPPGAVGELYLGGKGLARGYLHREELTRGCFVPSPFVPNTRLYRTGDLVRWRADGVLVCLGRTDHQIKLRGYRIELGEIEACIARHSGVRQVVVVAREDAPGDKRLVAYIVPQGSTTDLFDQLRAQLRAAVPEYMVPAHFVSLDTLPLTANGKVDRKALPSPRQSDVTSRADSYVAPRTELETSLVTAWQQVLGLPRVGIHDNFFDLGGNSLALVKLMLEVEKLTGLEIALGNMFRFPTIAALLESLGSGATEDASLVIPLQPDGQGTPIFLLSGILLYQELANSLGRGQPVYGVYAAEEHTATRQALKGEKIDISSARLAKAYYDAILRISPEGPYRLAGVSFGGIVALEVASMMRQQGKKVEFVGLFDTLSPRATRRRWGRWARQLLTREGQHKLLRKLSKMGDKLVAGVSGSHARDSSSLAEESHLLKQNAFYAAVGRWKPEGFLTDCKIVLFRATDQDWGPEFYFEPDYGWHHYLGPSLSVVEVRGTHLGILANPNVAELARKVHEQFAIGTKGPVQP